MCCWFWGNGLSHGGWVQLYFNQTHTKYNTSKTINKAGKRLLSFSHFAFYLHGLPLIQNYSLNVLFCSREAWLHGKPKDSSGGNINLPSLEVPKSFIILNFILS